MQQTLTRDEENIINESQEVTSDMAPQWATKLLTAFPAFRSHNYRLYFFGQLISLIGTWLQIVAEGWLVWQLTNSAFWVGLVAALGNLPVLFFALFGGVITDRFDKRKLLVFTQVTAMILALILGVLTVTHTITVLHVSILAFLLGTTTALDLPARQAFLPELVGKTNLSSAIALNAGMFNGARVIGPGIAGILIGLFGVGGLFILNGLSYIAATIALFYMRLQPHITQEHSHPLQAIKEGIVYSFTHPVIRILIMLSGIMAIFGWSYMTILPVIVQNVFHENATTLGYFYAIAGAGALLGAIFVSMKAEKIDTIKLILLGNIIYTIAMFLFSLTTNVTLALILLFFTGFGLVIQFSLINTAIQHMVNDKIRGRVLSVYTLMFLGLSPLGSLQIGLLAEHFSAPVAIQWSTAIIALCVVYLFINRQKLSSSYEQHRTTIV